MRPAPPRAVAGAVRRAAVAGAPTKRHTELISEIIALLFAGVFESSSNCVQKLNLQQVLLPKSSS